MSHRFHVHLHVADLAQSIGFYSKLFAAEPARRESDYAKWMLDDPPVTLMPSSRAAFETIHWPVLTLRDSAPGSMSLGWKGRPAANPRNSIRSVAGSVYTRKVAPHEGLGSRLTATASCMQE